MGRPNRSSGADAANRFFYKDKDSGIPVNETAQQLFDGQGNLFGIYAENESASAPVYLQFFDKAASDPATVTGVDVPDFTYRVPAGGAFGKDAQANALVHLSRGCRLAATTGRSNGVAPDTNPPMVQVYFERKGNS